MTSAALLEKYLLFLPKEGCAVQLAQSCLTLCDPMHCGLLGPSVHGILQAVIVDWVAIPLFRGSS